MFEHVLYLVSLIGALTCLGLIDYRWRLVFFKNPKAAAKVLAFGILFFVAWDASGIALGIFYSGHSRFMTNVYLGLNFPLEELFFLGLLCYLPMLAYEGLERRKHV
jgi:lycopene cyclase domain-containing protein